MITVILIGSDKPVYVMYTGIIYKMSLQYISIVPVSFRKKEILLLPQNKKTPVSILRTSTLENERPTKLEGVF